MAHNPFDTGYYCSEELRKFGFAYVGGNVQVARNCTIMGLHNISLGDNCRIDAGCGIFATTGKLVLEGFNHIGGGSHLGVSADLTFGLFSGLSQNVAIYTSSDDYSGRTLTGPCVPAHLRNYKTAAIDIGRHCIVGSGSVILPGCHMHEGAAVGALSLVTKPLQPWSLYHGNPAKRLRNRSKNVLDLECQVVPAIEGRVIPLNSSGHNRTFLRKS